MGIKKIVTVNNKAVGTQLSTTASAEKYLLNSWKSYVHRGDDKWPHKRGKRSDEKSRFFPGFMACQDVSSFSFCYCILNQVNILKAQIFYISIRKNKKDHEFKPESKSPVQ